MLARRVPINVEIINCLGEFVYDNQNFREELKYMLAFFSFF